MSTHDIKSKEAIFKTSLAIHGISLLIGKLNNVTGCPTHFPDLPVTWRDGVICVFAMSRVSFRCLVWFPFHQPFSKVQYLE